MLPMCLSGMRSIAGDERFIERSSLLPEVVEGTVQLLIDGFRAGGLSDQVPLDPGFECGLGEVAAADHEEAA